MSRKGKTHAKAPAQAVSAPAAELQLGNAGTTTYAYGADAPAAAAERQAPPTETAALSQESRDANALAAVTTPHRFRRRAVVVDAIRADGSPESNRAVIDWARESVTPAFMDKNGDNIAQLSINTLEGTMWVARGDYVVRGVKGEHYPVKPDIFHELYDPAGEEGDRGVGFSWPPPGLDQNTASAYAAACCAFPKQGLLMFYGWMEPERDGLVEIQVPRLTCAAAFLRQHRDAEPASAAIHLRLNGFRDTPEPFGRALVAWKVFAVTLAELDALDAAEAMVDAARRRAEAGEDVLGLRHGKGPFEPSRGGPFDATGFEPS